MPDCLFRQECRLVICFPDAFLRDIQPFQPFQQSLFLQSSMWRSQYLSARYCCNMVPLDNDWYGHVDKAGMAFVAQWPPCIGGLEVEPAVTCLAASFTFLCRPDELAYGVAFNLFKIGMCLGDPWRVYGHRKPCEVVYYNGKLREFTGA